MLITHGCEYGLRERQPDPIGWFDEMIIETGSNRGIAITLLAITGIRNRRGVGGLRHQASQQRG
jgi:hypothetical protein